MASEPATSSGPSIRTGGAMQIGGGTINTGLVTLVKNVPSEVSLGDTYFYTLKVTANEDVCDVVVTDSLPNGTSFVRAEPSVSPSGDKLTWRFDKMDRGQTETLTVYVRAESEGQLTTCACVTAIPRICLSTFVGKPALAIEKTGPATATLGQEITYNIVVRNTGNAVARNTVVTDDLPGGLTHRSGQRSLSFNAGDLAPGQSASFPVTVTAAERGRHCNPAYATATGVSQVNAEACTVVQKPGVSIEKSGTESQFVGRRAEYTITVRNTGDTVLQNVVVTDTAPAETSIVAAPGASVAGNTATWTVGSLDVGAVQTYSLTLTSNIAGRHCNNVSVATGEGLRDQAQACTNWRGIAAILVELIDDPDPVEVGGSSVYTIRVTNQGNADLTNVSTVMSLPSELDAISSSQGSISGKTVELGTVPVLAGKQSVEYRVTVRGVSAGEGRTLIRVSADQISRPVTEEENTTVY